MYATEMNLRQVFFIGCHIKSPANLTQFAYIQSTNEAETERNHQPKPKYPFATVVPVYEEIKTITAGAFSYSFLAYHGLRLQFSLS